MALTSEHPPEIASAPSNFPVETSTDRQGTKNRELRELLATAQNTIQQVSVSWQNQLFQNMDELKESLKEKLTDQDYQAFCAGLETFIKRPLRRQMGRIRCVVNSLEETKRYMK